MAEIFNDEHVTEILSEKNFTILEMINEEERPGFIISHDLRPDDHIKIFFITKDNAGEDILSLEFEGSDEYTSEESTIILNEVADTFIEIVERAEHEEEEPEEPEVPEEE